MNKKQNELRGTIRLLGGLLGETIIAQEGRDVFEMEEEIRKLAKAWRTGDADAKQRLDEIIPSLVNDLPLAAANLKAFSTYFQLVNLAEERERVRILRERAEAAKVFKPARATAEMDVLYAQWQRAIAAAISFAE